jgi:antitoxin ParD1/3/4
MNVSVGANWEAFIAGLVKEGRYASATEIMREGLRLVQEREEKRNALREMIDSSIAEGGEHSSDDVMAGIRLRAKAMKVAG